MDFNDFKTDWLRNSVILEPKAREALGLNEKPSVLEMGLPTYCSDKVTLAQTKWPESPGGEAGLTTAWYHQNITTKMVKCFVEPDTADPYEFFLTSTFADMYFNVLNQIDSNSLGMDLVFFTRSQDTDPQKYVKKMKKFWMKSSRKAPTKAPIWNFSSKKCIFFPVLEAVHWTLMVACPGLGKKPNQLVYFDSMLKHGESAPAYVKKFASTLTMVLRDMGKCRGQEILDRNWGLVVAQVYVQKHDWWTCGYHMISFADRMSRGVKVQDMCTNYDATVESMHRTRKELGRVALGLQLV